ncbi:MAG TPA: carbohydrate kinase family protein [Ilumatobacteraceae bacterium]|nr:carbohydrate kinase family protein [Ilumatobacteraceae bacterium]
MVTDRALRALVLGGVAWNTMVYLDEFPPARAGTVFARATRETVGSSGAGKALNLRRLGVDVTLWCLLGDDEWADRIRRVLADAGVDLLSETDPAGTMRHVNLMDAAGDRLSIFANPGSHDIDVDVDVVERVAGAADVIAVTILPHCRQFLPVLERAGRRIWVDLHDYDGVNPYHDEFIAAADHLMMSSIAMSDWRSFLEARIAAGATTAVCTHGAAGASGLSATEGWVDVPARPVAVVDTNGAGDAFFAGFAATWVGGEGLAAAMDAGTEAAAAAVQSVGLAPE